MNVAIRVDASVSIGAGHAVRCLALADALRKAGSRVRFVARQLPDALAQSISQHGHELRRFQSATDDWQDDARETAAAMTGVAWDWLIVDHYELDSRWEATLSRRAHGVMAIDDLADRSHECDVVLDQNDERRSRYELLVSSRSDLWLGPRYALVPPVFASLRQSALSRRAGSLERILVFMGSGDLEDETRKVLAGLERLDRPALAIDVVVGADHPSVDGIGRVCRQMPAATLHVQTSRMAELTLRADLAIGAGGGATWERCVHGLPALVTLMAEHQRDVAERLARLGAQRVIGWWSDLSPDEYAGAVRRIDSESLLQMANHAAGLCDGLGASRVATRLFEKRARDHAHA